ncbi:MAG: molecular chaperone HtpG [Polyangiales bacterium]|jgi:molecular chaperone HtpG
MTEANEASEKTTHSFQAEVAQVLSLVINSLYSNKDVFLRELVSNASDSLDKVRFAALTDSELADTDALKIRISADPEKKTLTISDNGIGMSSEELVENLGTVARSGSRDFLARLKEAQNDVSLIGQFGVGFYSAYLVADRVDVVSRSAADPQAHRWSSDAGESFTIEPAERAERGTDLILHLKEDSQDLLKESSLKALIKRYSDYIEHPIELEVESSEGEGDDKKTVKKFEKVNEASALWQRSASEVTDEQYQEFYKHLTHDWEAPLTRRHFKVEGTQMFSGLLFVPRKPPFDLFSSETSHGVRLHVKRVFIMDDCDELLPRWLRFIRGVVDSADLPLNVSREILQDSAVVRVIQKQVVRRSLDMIEELQSSDDYGVFVEHFGSVLKEGLHFENEPKLVARIAKLCRWESTHGEGPVSLEDYVGRMKEGQKAIYYVFGASRQMVENAPHLEMLKARGYEVLLMTDAIDQWAVDGLQEFDGKQLVSVMASDLQLDETEEKEDAEEKKKSEEELDGLLGAVRTILKEQVSEVRISDRLAGSPACLVLPDGGLPPYLERLMRMQQQNMPKQKRVLELNPKHDLILALRAMQEKEPESEKVTEWVNLLLNQALLAEGSPLENPAMVVQQMTSLLTEVVQRAST